MKSDKLQAFIVWALCFFVGCDSDKSPKKLPQKLSISNEVTIGDIRNGFKNNDYTITELTRFYLHRIDSLNFRGPELNAVISLNPDALSIANSLDNEMKNGNMRGPLHGIPVLLKDNIDTGDKMPCTAGSRIMKDSYPEKDSPLAAQLRAAGAVILGKANMSEWANFHSFHSSSGWSGLGGQTKNPYDTTRNPCGSSSGSAVAVAANLCVLAIGTETNGSIVCPSNNNGIVGIKPTVGLISRRGIIPISFTQDTAGPMARTLEDAALCLGALTAIDSLDKKTLNPERKSYSNYTQFLKRGCIRGKRIGYYIKPLDSYTRVRQLMDKAIDFFQKEGAELVEVATVIPSETRDHSYQVLLHEFKHGLNTYLSDLGPDTPVKDLETLISRTMHDSIETRYNNFELLQLAQTKGDLRSEEYLQALSHMLRMSRDEGIDKIMDKHRLDAIIAPSGGPAWKTDLINGDSFHISSSAAAAIAGYPNITVPMGEVDGLPVGLSIFGRAWSEPVLLEIAYGFEQGTLHRISPAGY